MLVAQKEQPFSVELSNDPFSENPGHDKCFLDEESALKFLEAKKGTFLCEWLAERGVYETQTGTLKTDWIYYWWNKNVADAWNWEFPPPGRGEGHPLGAMSRLVSYLSLR